MLRNSVVNKAYSTQLVRSSSSVYANYRAAQREKSSADFLYKLKIVEQECDESIGFLELLRVFNPSQREKIEAIANEAEELLKIFVASIKTVKNKIDLNKKSKQQ
jgi:four helix bundle protein